MSLVNDDDSRQDNVGLSHQYSYKHYSVEAKFEGHEETSSAEIILRKENADPSGGAHRGRYVGDHHGINQGGNYAKSFTIILR